eukprot:CCRYP_015397-RB/>CCRYP_015397-RB protein AED:0.04 eAED:0.04 QI:1097/1/1/1/0.75/0.8/5/65/564
MMEDEAGATKMEAALDLEEQLQSAVQLATELKQENDALKRELEDARSFSKESQRRNSEWRESWKKELDVISKREKELEREEAKWKRRLDDRKLELEDMERKYNLLSEQEVSTLDQVQLSKSEYASKLNRLKDEATKWRQSYYEARQSSQQFQAKLDDCTAQVQQERETCDTLQRTIVSLKESFASQIEDNKNANSKPSEEIVRDLKRQIADRDFLLLNLQEELRAVEQDRNAAVMARDALVKAHQVEIAGLKLEYERLECNNQILEKRLSTSGKIMNDNAKIKAELEEKIDCATKEVNRLQSCLKTLEESHESETKRFRNEVRQSNTESKKQLSSFKMLLLEEQEKTKTLEQRCSEMHEHAIMHINQLAKDLDKTQKNDCTEKLLIAHDQIVKLENTITLLQNDIMQASLDHDAQCHRLQHAIETCHQELNLTLMERKETMQTLEAEKAQSEQFQRDLVTCQASLTKFEHKCKVLEEENSRLSALAEDHQYRNESLSRELRVLSDKTKEIKENASKALLQAEEFKEKLSKEKRRSGAYKEKALEAHQRSVKAKEVLDSICRIKD